MSEGSGPREDLGFDPEALRARYALERDKRLRDDGIGQYVEVSGELAHFVEDPYVEPGFSRKPVTDEVDVVLIGGGFGGLQCGARLREAGVEQIRVIEKGGDFGGTWYWNRYPGAQCDVESYIYMPLLEELGSVPTMKYASGAEILAHSQAIGRHYRLYDQALFQTEVTKLEWDTEASRWIVSTNRDDAVRARFVAMANGPLHRPKLPGIPGIEKFRGHAFHTSRWDYNYTGGSPEGGLERLRDKRIAVIGTGATAVQCVPHLGETAKELFVFQRTPSSIDVRDNTRTDPAWAQNLEPGWQKTRMDNFNALVSGVPQESDLVDDAWTDLIGRTIDRFRRAMEGGTSGPDIAEILEISNFEKMNEIRARVEALVEDPRTAEALKPYYRMFCKRPCFHDDYLQTFNRPNVTLVDTDGKGVDRITERGIVVKRKEYEVDCIIYATGFEVGTSYARRSGYEIVGRTGRTLTQKWEDGVRTLHGMHSREFPNCFILSMSQGAFSVNYPHLLDHLAIHLAYIVRHALDNDVRTVEASEEAEEAWVQAVLGNMNPMSHPGGGDCTPSYYNMEGKPNPKAMQGAPYGGMTGSISFWSVLKKWRDAGKLEGLELRS